MVYINRDLYSDDDAYLIDIERFSDMTRARRQRLRT